MNLQKIATICQGEILGINREIDLDTLLIDSRKVSHASSALFICLVTNRDDGHDYIVNAYEKGVRVFLTSTIIDKDKFPDASFVLVTDTKIALQKIAKAQRELFKNIPVLGITGSNGKTIVKEWLYQILEQHFNIVRSPKSYNSQIGVALSVWEMNAQHNLAIFEAGISEPQEMQSLAQMIQPTIGIITNIGTAHNEQFNSVQEKLDEKLKLFQHAQKIIYCHDHTLIDSAIRNSKLGKKDLWYWGKSATCTLVILSKISDSKQTKIRARFKESDLELTIPFIDEASVENVIHCWLAALSLGLVEQDIQQAVSLLAPIAMRLELKTGANNSVIINDSYNSDLAALNIALDFLALQHQYPNYTVILSDIAQAGADKEQLYDEVVDLIAQKNIKTFIGIGADLAQKKDLFERIPNLKSSFYLSTDQFIDALDHHNFSNQTVLLKGARSFKFENINNYLEARIHQTVLEINLNAITDNYHTYRQYIKSDVAVMAMVKAFSYGSGAYEVADKLQFLDVEYLAVAYADEGVSLRNSGIKLPIMVMNPDVNAYAALINYDLEPELYSLYTLKQFIETCTIEEVLEYPVHLKLDTGMHRLGFQQEEFLEVLTILKDNPYIKVKSVFSHLAASDDETLDEFTNQQAQLFDSYIEQLDKVITYPYYRHLCNTGGIIRHPNLHYNMVRLGIGLYGVDSTKIKNKIKSISRLKTSIAQIKHIAANETIGYSRKGIVNRPSVIGTVCIGYADGIPRSLGNGNGKMFINGKLAPIIGNICMDMCMLDITDIDHPQVGDEVIIFGPELPITQVATWANTIPYEIMTGISMRVKRVYFEE
jgi:Alr-MurF fusion protein